MQGNTEQDDQTPTPSSSPDGLRPAGARHRRAWKLVLLAVFGISGVVGLLLMVAIIGIRADLLRARDSMERGAGRLLEGDAQGALESFVEGGRQFTEAERRSTGPLLRVVGWLPVVGRTADAVHAIASSGATSADAAQVLAMTLTEIPGGAAGLAPAGGAVPTDLIPPLAAAALEAEELMAHAVATVEAAPATLLIGPVAPARREAEEELRRFHDAVHAAALVLEGLPRFLGSEEPRRYFFGAQNPAELRGTGGLIGAYSILTIDAGEFSFGTFRPIQSLPILPLDAVEPPNVDYDHNYQEFRGGRRFWTAINVMPDLPSVAQMILDSFEAATGERLDGVILADPFALEALLRSVGSAEVPGYDASVNAANVVPFVTNEAYSLLPEPPARKRILGEVAKAAFERFLLQPDPDARDLRLLLRAAADRHILVFSVDESLQAGLEATPAAGALAPPGGDDELVSVVANSAAGSKVDFYQERLVELLVTLQQDGSAVTELTVVLRNDAPTSGEPRYVIGPFRPPETAGSVGPILTSIEAGQSVTLLNVYCGATCFPREVRQDGSAMATTSRIDLGVRYVQQYFAIPSGEEASLGVSWTHPEAWEGNSSGGAYRLTFANQVTIRPTTVRIRIEPPPRMLVTSAGAPLRIVDGVAVYEGQPGALIDVAVEFAPSVPLRLWRNVTRFLTQPVFDL